MVGSDIPVNEWTTQNFKLTLFTTDFVGDNDDLLYFEISVSDVELFWTFNLLSSTTWRYVLIITVQ